MAKLRMPKGELTSVSSGGNGNSGDVPFDTSEPSAVETATAMLEGGEEDGEGADGLGDWETVAEDGEIIEGNQAGNQTVCETCGAAGSNVGATFQFECGCVEDAMAGVTTPCPKSTIEPIIVTPEEIAEDDIAEDDAITNEEAESILSGATDAAEATTPPAPEEQPVVDGEWKLEPELKVAVERMRARQQWEESVASAKESLVEITLELADLKGKAKSAKEEFDDAIERLSDLLSRNPDYNPSASLMNTRPVAEAPAVTSPASESPTLAENGEADRPTAEAAAAHLGQSPPTDWRSTPITCLTSLTPKLIERLEEAGLTTMGKLEDRRAEIALSNGGEKWPKGIGEVKITAIEDAVIDWLTENRDKAVFQDLASGKAREEQAEEQVQSVEGEQVEQTAEQPADEQPVAEEAPAEFTTTTDAANPPSPPFSATPDEVAAMIRRAADLNTGESGCLESKYLDAVWTEGYEAFQAHKGFPNCEYRPSQAQDDWLRGWMSARATKEYETKEAATAVPVLKDRLLFDADDI